MKIKDSMWFQKSDNSPLTQADIASHSIIKHALNDISPSIPIFLLKREIRDSIQGEISLE